MSLKKIEIKNASKFIFNKHIPLIAKFVPGIITYSDLPIDVIIIDPETNEEINAQLVDIQTFLGLNIIPDILCRIATGEPSSKQTETLLQKNKVNHPNQLAFYCYEIKTN